jgi:ATP-dependent Clp protease adaptor protein ClpS
MESVIYSNRPMTKPQEDWDVDVMLEEEEEVSNGDQSNIVVYNDEVNTFDWVIQCFEEILNHTQEQAEQLSVLIHFKGKASVKSGGLQVLRPFKDALCDRGLSAVIESK